jgi:L-lysine 6-transaminase
VRKNLAAGRGEQGQKILHFREAFHGRSGYTLSVTNTDPNKTRYFPKFDWPRVTNPKLRFPIDQQVLAEVEHAEQEAVREIERALAENEHDIAAILIEPIQCEGGDNHFRGEFLHRLRALADDREVLLIFDEVQTGFGSTGRWWCSEHFDVLPDIFAFGKKTQICGIAASRRLDEVDSVFQVPSRINSTWGGNLVDMIRCRRVIEVIEEDGLIERAARSGATLLEGLRSLEHRFSPRISNTRGRGVLLAFDLADAATRNRVLTSLRQHLLLALPCGPRSVRFRPALILELDIVVEALRRIEAGLEAAFG